jgi:hypothetical protein
MKMTILVSNSLKSDAVAESWSTGSSILGKLGELRFGNTSDLPTGSTCYSARLQLVR